MRVFLALLLLLTTITGCGAPGGGPAPQGGGQTPQTGGALPPAPTPAVAPYGDASVQVFLWGTPATSERDLKLAKDAGFKYVKQMFQWNFIEGKGKGKFEWNEPDRIVELVRKYDLKLIARLDVAPTWARVPRADEKLHGPPAKMSDFGDFAGAVAERYKGKIHAYQIWNEPNLAREWDGKAPNAVEFTEMMKVSFEAIKKADSAALVINGGLSPTTAPLPLAVPDVQFMKDMYKAGANKYFDMFGVHAAGFASPPQADPTDVAKDPKATNGDPSPVEAKRVYAFRHVEDLRKIMVDNGDTNKKIAILEFGWTTDTRKGSDYAWFGVPEETKARFIVDALKYAETNYKPWLGFMSLIYICAPHWTEKDEQWYWSITHEDGDTRTSYDAIKSYLKKA